MAIRKRSDLEQSTYVFVEDGIINVRTPPDTAKWPFDFRLRIVRDYISPNKLMPTELFTDNFIKSGLLQKHYFVQGQDLRIANEFEPVVNTQHVLIRATHVLNYTQQRGMVLIHSNPAMRCLMIYSFLTIQRLKSVPDFRIFDL